MRSPLDRIERAFVAVNRWLLILLLAVMACIVFTNVVLRYLTNESLYWAEEVARHLMVCVSVATSRSRICTTCCRAVPGNGCVR